MKALPARGKMALFNRSYYEDVLVVKVHALQKNYNMPARVLEDPDFFKKRYRQIRPFEEYLYENGCRVGKIFRNLSREKQKERVLEQMCRRYRCAHAHGKAGFRAAARRRPAAVPSAEHLPYLPQRPVFAFPVPTFCHRYEIARCTSCFSV